MRFFLLLLLTIMLGFVGFNFDNAHHYPIWITFPIMFGTGVLAGKGFTALMNEERH